MQTIFRRRRLLQDHPAPGSGYDQNPSPSTSTGKSRSDGIGHFRRDGTLKRVAFGYRANEFFGLRLLFLHEVQFKHTGA
jgi:hypothetical protein